MSNPVPEWTILLSRPDYIRNDPSDTYLWQGHADTVEAAINAARIEAATTDELEECNLTDYLVLAAFAGTHDDINPEH